MKRRILSKLLACVLCLAMVLLLPLTVSASENGSLSITFRHDEHPINNAVFNLYRVADRSDGGSYTLTDKFAGYSVSLVNLNNDSLNALATTLSTYVARDNTVSDAQAVSDINGKLSFNNLSTGLYLVIGDSVTEQNVTYIPQPFIVSLPSQDAYGNTIYNVNVDVKYERRDDPPQTLERHVLKIWEDTGYEEQRPQEITVQLLKDGEVFDEMVLNSDNNWRYSWSGLDASSNWQIAEKDVPEKYTVAILQQGITFTVTNTFDDIDTPQETTAPTDTPQETTSPTDTPQETTVPTNNSQETTISSDTPQTTAPQKDETLPQTGMLWWPVPVLLGAGIVMLIVGIILRKRRENPHD